MNDEVRKLIESMQAPKKVDRRNFDFDFIYTTSAPEGMCCIAVQSGMKYGFQSGCKGCPRIHDFSGRHEVTFIDCDYKQYDHKKHLSSVRRFRPKYATIRDIMSKEQCEIAGIQYFSLDRILEYATELDKYAENVILIPKIDVISQLPSNFMLGYSIPTSHGGTTVPIELFKDFKVHLLGGAWKKQLYYIERYSNIVSCDNNHIHKIAKYANFNHPDGRVSHLTKDLGLDPVNHWYVATILSIGNIAKKLNEIFGEKN